MFDLSTDPAEERDLAAAAAAPGQWERLENDLRTIVDPEAIAAAARADQLARLTAAGGIDRVRVRDSVPPYTPPPVEFTERPQRMSPED